MWKRKSIQGESNGDVCSLWIFEGEPKLLFYKVTVREFISNWGPAKQVSILKENEGYGADGRFAKEPTMSEKEQILKDVQALENMKKPVAFEVFPAKCDIVDKFDMYHLWIASQEEIPFWTEIKSPKVILTWNAVILDGKFFKHTLREYVIKGQYIKVLLIQEETGAELKWREKQQIKDLVVDEAITAVEFVGTLRDNISALVLLPEDVKIPFGLKS